MNSPYEKQWKALRQIEEYAPHITDADANLETVEHSIVSATKDLRDSLEYRRAGPAEAAERIATQISDYVNSYGNYTQVAKEMVRDHRTLQQCKMRMVMEFIYQMAEQGDGEYPAVDGRNEAAVKLARFIRDAVIKAQDAGEPVGYLPLI